MKSLMIVATAFGLLGTGSTAFAQTVGVNVQVNAPPPCTCVCNQFTCWSTQVDDRLISRDTREYERLTTEKYRPADQFRSYDRYPQ